MEETTRAHKVAEADKKDAREAGWQADATVYVNQDRLITLEPGGQPIKATALTSLQRQKALSNYVKEQRAVWKEGQKAESPIVRTQGDVYFVRGKDGKVYPVPKSKYREEDWK